MRTAVVRGREDSGYFLADAPADAASWEDHVKPVTRQAWGIQSAVLKLDRSAKTTYKTTR